MALDTAAATALVRQLYAAVLGRAPDAFGPDTLVPLLVAGYDPAAIRAGLAFGSPEAASLVGAIYQSALGRAADPAGLRQYLTGLANGMSLADVRTSLVGSAEARAFQSVSAVYAQVLGRSGDAAGLAVFTNAVSNGMSFAAVQAQLANSPEAAATLSRSHELNFGVAPAAATLATLQNELAFGQPLPIVEQVIDRQTRISGFFTNNWGYTVPAGAATSFLSVASDSNKLYQGSVQVIPAPVIGPSAFGPGSDTIVLDMGSVDGSWLDFIATLDGQSLGVGTLLTTRQDIPFASITRDRFTFSGDFGPGLHTLHIAVAGDPAAGFIVSAATFDGNAFLLGSASSGASGAVDLYPHPGPQPVIPIVST